MRSLAVLLWAADCDLRIDNNKQEQSREETCMRRARLYSQQVQVPPLYPYSIVHTYGFGSSKTRSRKIETRTRDRHHDDHNTSS
jgi:hypothetical protein